MIGVIDVEIQAANPSMPLFPMRAFQGSPSSVRVRNVPKKIGQGNITSVQIVAAYPDSSIKTANCKLVGGVWVGTIEGCAISGKSENGFTVFASGTDENGNAVSNYVLGKGDIQILESDGTLSPDTPSYYVHLYDEEPTTKKEGDLYPTEDGYVIWQDGEAHGLGMSDEEVIEIINNTVPSLIPSNVSAFNNDAGYVTASTVSAQLATKQDVLSVPQMSAINSVVDERATIVEYNNGTVESYNIVGEVNASDIPNRTFAVDVKFGTAVTSIGDGTFATAGNLAKVTIPNSVTSIGDRAFRYCTNLTSIVIPDSVTTIGNEVFGGCNGITRITLGNGLTTIGDEAFRGCIHAVGDMTIPSSVTSIGDRAFYNCPAFTKMTIPSSVTSIGDEAFAYCIGLTNLFFKDNTIETVQAMTNYPWGISASIIGTWHDANKEYVDSQIGAVLTESF